MKIKLKDWSSDVRFPELCAVVGKHDATIEERPIRSSYFLGIASIQTVLNIPMSQEGWEKYRGSFTGIDRFHESANTMCHAIPLFGGLLLILYFFYLFLPLAIINIFLKKSKDKIKISLKKEGTTPFLRGALLEIPSIEFGKAFIEKNQHLEATEI